MVNQSQPSKSISSSLVNGLVEQIMTVMPFSEMDKESVEIFIKNCDEEYYEPDEIIIAPNTGVPHCLYLIRQGSVSGKRDEQQGESIYFELDAGEMFSIGSVLTNRPVSTVYRSFGDTFCLQFPVKKLTEFGIQSPRFIDFLKDSFRTILQKSQSDLHQHFVAKAAEAQLYSNTLESLVTRDPVSVLPQATCAKHWPPWMKCESDQFW